MICPKCNGRGTVGYYDVDHFVDVECDRCHGSGEVSEVEMTEEEWFCNLSTEEKARFLHDIQFSCNTCTLTSFRFYKSNIMKCPLQVSCAKENGIVEWLKQPHK